MRKPRNKRTRATLLKELELSAVCSETLDTLCKEKDIIANHAFRIAEAYQRIVIASHNYTNALVAEVKRLSN